MGPDGALGFIARGRVSSAEYRAIKTPRVETFTRCRKLRLPGLMGATPAASNPPVVTFWRTLLYPRQEDSPCCSGLA
jgi:hypothetical protein